MKKVIIPILALSLTGCFETFDVSAAGMKGFRFGTDVAAINYSSNNQGEFSYTMLRTNNSKSFKEGASVVKQGITGYGVVKTGDQLLQGKQSDNALKAAQATEATKQQSILTNPTIYKPIDGEAISRASDAGASVIIP